ncbi:hypothetical protein [Hominifimenecus sp. rT4P-3]|uniref:hypothetical protein n=1 Tax=Hominifimenecus sp. rT4P-3 TaxID=3242979 RepID=UPI003DA5F0D1
MTLQEFQNVLLSVTENVYHFEAAEASEKYVVWREIGGRALMASGHRREVIHEVQVEFCTKEEFDPMLEGLLNALEMAEIVFEEPLVEYDSETKQIRYTIYCEIV